VLIFLFNIVPMKLKKSHTENQPRCNRSERRCMR